VAALVRSGFAYRADEFERRVAWSHWGPLDHVYIISSLLPAAIPLSSKACYKWPIPGQV
jgi:hypothetical protein